MSQEVGSRPKSLEGFFCGCLVTGLLPSDIHGTGDEEILSACARGRAGMLYGVRSPNLLRRPPPM